MRSCERHEIEHGEDGSMVCTCVGCAFQREDPDTQGEVETMLAKYVSEGWFRP